MKPSRTYSSHWKIWQTSLNRLFPYPKHMSPTSCIVKRRCTRMTSITRFISLSFFFVVLPRSSSVGSPLQPSLNRLCQIYTRYIPMSETRVCVVLLFPSLFYFEQESNLSHHSTELQFGAPQYRPTLPFLKVCTYDVIKILSMKSFYRNLYWYVCETIKSKISAFFPGTTFVCFKTFKRLCRAAICISFFFKGRFKRK